MATYFLNAAGTNTAPYDTSAKGANTLRSLLLIISENSIIEVVSGTDIIEPYTPDVTPDPIVTDFDVVIRSWSGNGAVKPVIVFSINHGNALDYSTDAHSLRIENITFKVKSQPGSEAVDGIHLGSASLVFTRNEMIGIDESSGAQLISNLLYTAGAPATLSNNIFRGDTSSFLGIWSSAGSKIYNNAFICRTTGTSTGAYLRNVCTVKNNIFINAQNAALYYRQSNTAVVENYNCFYNNVKNFYHVEIVMGANSFESDPLFVSASDFQLQATSPCIASGIGPESDVNVPLVDFIGTTRSGLTTDIGAYKYQLIIPPVAGFSADNLSGSAPLTVTFTDSSTNTPTSWAWDFGDGDSSTDQNPVHIYSTPGLYTVGLTATNAGGSDGEIKIDYITVSTAAAPVKKPGDTKNPDDLVGMPGASDTSTGSNLRDTQLGTGPSNSGNTLEKNGNRKTQNKDEQYGSSDGARQRNNENTNGVKQLLPRIQELAQTIATFFYRIR